MSEAPIRRWLFVLLLVAATPVAGFEVRVRDSVDGSALTSRLSLSIDPQKLVVDDRTTPQTRVVEIAEGRGELTVDPGLWQFAASAAQHATLHSQILVNADTQAFTLLLDPLQVPTEIVATRALASRDPTRILLHGYVRDARDAQAVAGAQIRIDAVEGLAVSDSNGYFVFDAGASVGDGVPTPRTLRVQAARYASYALHQQILTAGATQLLVLLSDTPIEQQVEQRALLARDPRSEASPADRGSAAVIAALPVKLAPPGTIRVGFNDAGCTSTCCGTSCSNTCTMSLETYVKRGLDSEWIASWNAQSLRAGSLAYRSYGAWHVLHPRTASYDICSSACCQVNDASTAVSTDAAAARTPGLLLTRDGIEPYRAEFSAENNSWDDPADGLSCSNLDLSCGNGYAGSPSTGWPCLVDAVGAGRGCFGHGRGMSQWGTQRWAIAATPKLWKWITNHYYNDNANESGAGSDQRTATITSPLALGAIGASPASVNAGASFTIQLAFDNLAGASHSHLLIGASLYKSGIGYISDAAHDATLVATAGSGNAARTFTIPAGTASGVYDLVVALYLDVDENGLISVEDLALSSLTRTAHVSIGNERIYANGFES